MADSQADNSVKSNIIMKVDVPAESTSKDGNDVENLLGHQICSASRPLLASSKLAAVSSTTSSQPFTVSNSTAASNIKSLLRPSQLGSAQNKLFSLNPSKLFVKPAEESSKNQQNESTNGETPKFVPLVTTTSKEKASEVSSTSKVEISSNSSFVFGQNLQDRVVTDGNTSDDSSKPSTSFLSSTTNGNSSSAEMLFSSAAKETVSSSENVCTPSKSLNESAREIEEQRNNKRKYEEVEVITGEEDETNVLQISCKLFAFDKGISNWQERGRGNLRLNDRLVKDADGSFYRQSRVVFRTSGVLKVILNTKVWSQMRVEQASQKSVRFTAVEPCGEIKVYLAMANAEDSKQLFSYLRDRVSNEQKREKVKKIAMDTTNDDDDDENNWDVGSTTTSTEDK